MLDEFAKLHTKFEAQVESELKNLTSAINAATRAPTATPIYEKLEGDGCTRLDHIEQLLKNNRNYYLKRLTAVKAKCLGKKGPWDHHWLPASVGTSIDFQFKCCRTSASVHVNLSAAKAFAAVHLAPLEYWKITGAYLINKNASI